MKTKLEHFIHSAGFTSCLASIASILMGLLVGLVLLYAFNAPFALYGFKQILTAGSPPWISWPRCFIRLRL